MLIDMPLTIAVLLNLYSGLKSLKNPKWLIPFSFFALTSLTLKIGGLLFIFANTCAILHLKSSKKFDKKALATTSLTVFIIIALVIFALPSLQKRISEQINIFSITDNLLRFIQIGNNNPTIGLPNQIGYPQTLLLLGFIYITVRKPDTKRIFLGLLILIPFIIAHDTKSRYLMPMMPAISLASAVYLSRITESAGKKILIFSFLTMTIITSSTVIPFTQDYTINNVIKTCDTINQADVNTVGVYGYILPVKFNPHYLAAISDLYCNKQIIFLGFNYQHGYEYSKESWSLERRMLTTVYPSLSTTPEDMQELLFQNYTNVKSLRDGKHSFYDTSHVNLYIKQKNKSGPTDAILYISSFNIHEFEISNWSKTSFCYDCINYFGRGQGEGHDWFTQTQAYGPLNIGSTYGMGRDSWLGELILTMKPPSTGQVNATYNFSVSPPSVFDFSISLRPDTWHHLKGDGVEFIVLINGENVFNKYIDPKNNIKDRRLHHQQINLIKYSGQTVNITLMTKSGPNNSSIYDTAGWGNPRIINKN